MEDKIYTTDRYVVAVKRPFRTVWEYKSGFHSFASALDAFRAVTAETDPDMEQAALFTRVQWHRGGGMRRHKNLKERNDPIPASLGMWLINQADSGHL